jgi:hypothetical protein
VTFRLKNLSSRRAFSMVNPMLILQYPLPQKFGSKPHRKGPEITEAPERNQPLRHVPFHQELPRRDRWSGDFNR